MGDGGSEMKECWYSILGVERTASRDEIRSAYRKEALKWHPDKIQQSGASAEECQRATARFQSIALAWEVLGDPTERAWYDKHRNEILSSGTASKDFDISVWSFFSSSTFSGYSETGKGFFKVYGDVFKKIYKREQEFAKAYGMGPIGESPSIGCLHSDYAEVDAFYKFWLGFATIKDFAWCDEYRISDARNRKERRLMEEENSKIRKRERREFNSAVRELASFVKKRDKRVQEKQIELQRLQAEKEQQLKLRRQQLQEEKLAKARAYEEQDWAKISDDTFDEERDINEDEGSYHWKNSNKSKKDSKTGDGDNENPDEFYCIVCSKRFKSEKQWNNHERSKKHIERAFSLKQSLLEEDEEANARVKNLEADNDDDQKDPDIRAQFVNTECDEGSAEDDEKAEAIQGSSKTKEEIQPSRGNEESDVDQEEEEEEDEESLLAAMLSSHRSKKAVSVPVGSTSNSDRGEDLIPGEHQVEDMLPPAVTDKENFSGADDDHIEKDVLDSTLRAEEGPGILSVAPEVSHWGHISDDDGSEEETNSKKKPGKPKTRRRSKQERQLLASKERHNDILKELYIDESSKTEGNDGGESSSIHHGVDNTVAGEEQEDKRTSSDAPGKKTNPSQRLKQLKHDVPARPRVSDSSLKLEVLPNESSKKGVRARGKKTKAATKPQPSNTCDTCGENFESRNQLFRHITVTNHGSVKSK